MCIRDSSNISCTEFGVDPVGRIDDILIECNTFHGGGGAITNAVFLDSSVDRATIQSNDISGNNHIAVIRHSELDVMVRNNRMNGGDIVTSSNGGRFVEYGNDGANNKPSDSDSAYLSALMVASKDYLDIPGGYLKNSEMLSNITAGESRSGTITYDEIISITSRTVSLKVLSRRRNNDSFGSFNIQVLVHVVGGYITANISNKYASIGLVSDDISVTTENEGVDQIDIVFTNDGSEAIDITYIPSISNRLGSETD